MLWQINLFDVEFKNGKHARFVGTFAYAQEVLPMEHYDKLGIHMIWSHVMTWDSPQEGFREERLAYARKHIFTGKRPPEPEIDWVKLDEEAQEDD